MNGWLHARGAGSSAVPCGCPCEHGTRRDALHAVSGHTRGAPHVCGRVLGGVSSAANAAPVCSVSSDSAVLCICVRHSPCAGAGAGVCAGACPSQRPAACAMPGAHGRTALSPPGQL